MSFIKALKLCGLCIVFAQSVYGYDVQPPEMHHNSCHQNSNCCAAVENHFGTAAFAVTDPNLWYTVSTNAYPNVAPLSIGRNRGEAEGGVYLSPTGITIGEAGNYFVTISAVLQNPTPDTDILIPVFLVLDDEFDGDLPPLIGGTVTLDGSEAALGMPELLTIKGDGFLRNVAPGTRLSLVVTNGGYEFPVPVKIASWGISVSKLP